MVKMLSKTSSVVVLDNLSTGFSHSVKSSELVIGDLSDIDLLEKIFTDHDFDGVMHFAAFSLVSESMVNPAKYYRNNVSNTLNLLDVMVKHNVKSLVFSSTAAVFGEAIYTPIDELHPQKPINPYGSSKLMVEAILCDYYKAYGLNSVSFRYFNASGADPEGEIGENHDPETHLIPLVLQAASGRRKSIKVFGRDYDTKDGTCVRDYIHVHDLCSAHALGLERIISGVLFGSVVFNLGNRVGYSVQQVIDVVKKVIAKDGIELIVEEAERRQGDPDILIADSAKANSVLGWKPVYDDLELIIRHAWEWEKKCVNWEC